MISGLSCLQDKTPRIEITIETAIGGGELQDAIVGVGDVAGIVLDVAVAPNHLLAFGIGQHLHRAAQHHAYEAFCIAEIDTRLGVGLVVGHTQRESVGGEIEHLNAFTNPW